MREYKHIKKRMISARFDLLFLALLFCIVLPVFSHAAKIQGRVFTESGPVKGAMVYVYKSYPDIDKGAVFLRSDPSDEQGQYALQVPDGEYYFVARGSKNGKDFFSYVGGNPVNIGKENVWVVFMANESKPPSYSKGASSVKGIVTYKGNPVKGALIAFYTLENRKFKGLGFRTEAVKDDGTFDFSLPPNKYVIIARQKKEGDKTFGPLKSGDLYCYYPGNPVEVKPGRIAQIEVPCYPKVERTTFVASPVIKTNDYKTVDKLAGAYNFGIKGRVTNSRGEAVTGIYVLAYKVDPSNTFALASTFRGTHETENIGKTDEKGSYFIPLDADGDYVIMARYLLGGGTPKVNEVYGFYNNTTRKGVLFIKGHIIDDINITVVTPVKEVGPEADNGKTR